MSNSNEPKILLISFDEQNKKYVKRSNKENIDTKDADLIICCTQDSVGCYGKDHFQHYLQYLLKDKKYSLISKADANKSKFFCLPSKDAVYNVRTRCYKNDNTLIVEGLKDIPSSNSDFYSARMTTHPVKGGKFYIEYISSKTITLSKDGGGLITYYIRISESNEKLTNLNIKFFDYVFCNYTHGSFNGYSNKILKSIEEIKSIPTSISKCPLEIFLVTKNKIKSGKFTTGSKPDIKNSNIKKNNTQTFKNIKKNTNSIIIIDRKEEEKQQISGEETNQNQVEMINL